MQISIRTLEDNLDIIKKYLEKNKITLFRYLVSTEKGTKNKNEHRHYHLEISHAKQDIKTVMRGIRRVLQNYYKSKNYYVKAVKDEHDHLVYITKDGEYYQQGYTEEELEKLAEENEEIEADKQLPVYQKLYNRICSGLLDIEMESMCLDKRWIIKQIILIYKEWNKPPPPKSLMFQYVNFVQSKHIDIDIVVENYI